LLNNYEATHKNGKQFPKNKNKRDYSNAGKI